MKLTSQEKASVQTLCNTFRKDLLRILYEKQTGHPGGSLSVCEILTSLYEYELNVTPETFEANDCDRVVLSKGHAAPMLYQVLAHKGFFPKEELNTLRDFESRLQGHPCSLKTPGVDVSSGPLGIGLSAAVGMALALKLNQSTARVYAVLGDGEINEGTIWEACMSASKFQLDNLCAILDWNKVQLDGTSQEIMPLSNIKERFESFGFYCIECDGHDVEQLCNAYAQARSHKGRPSMILAHTKKGKGVSVMEGKNIWHGKPIDDDSYTAAMKELEGDA